MTGEAKVEERFLEFADELIHCELQGKKWRKRIAELLADFVRQERLECAKAMCVRCKNGEVPERIEKSGYIENFDAVTRGDWIHRETTEYDCGYCAADKIHELIAALTAPSEAQGKPEREKVR